MIVLQLAVNKTFEVLHTTLMVTKMQRSLCCAKSSAAYDQSLSLWIEDGATDAAYVTQRCRTAGHDPRHVGLLGRVAVDVYLEVADVLSGLMSSAPTQISRVVQTIQYNTIQNDFYSAVIEGAEALVGRL